MKTKKKAKPRSTPKPARSVEEDADKVYTPMETGQPDRQRVAGIDNTAGAQGGLGPMNQEGEGESQNDQLAALEQIIPEG